MKSSTLPERIIFGGSFDPIHEGHYQLIRQLSLKYPKAMIHVVVSETPLLRDSYVASYHHRLSMVKLVLGDLPRVVISEKLGLTYTVDVVTTFKNLFPESKWYLLVGSDQIAQLHQWHRYQELLSMVQIIEATRGDNVSTLDYHQELLSFQHQASASSIRQGDFTHLSPLVRNYIYDHRLYYHYYLKNFLSPTRYYHSVSAAHYAEKLAHKYQANPQICYYAALFHDVAKELPRDYMLSLMQQHFPHLVTYHPNVYHSFVGSWWLKEHRLFEDEAIIRSVYEHTLGIGSDIYSQIIFVADKLEPLRKHFDHYLYQLSFSDLELTIQKIKERYQHDQQV